ncbi:hypothetical protein [Variovorax rhizosphaerae]|uniref:Uncharacterized protein n=1 Tax=Variovorax rhizosphaerae TaxID=1836200 RepID=A0ABU8WHU4_9BURK
MTAMLGCPWRAVASRARANPWRMPWLVRANCIATGDFLLCVGKDFKPSQMLTRKSSFPRALRSLDESGRPATRGFHGHDDLSMRFHVQLSAPVERLPTLPIEL